MRREIMIAKLRKQQQELKNMMKDLKDEKALSNAIKEAFNKRLGASEILIETIQDKSFIPGTEVDFNVTKEMKSVEKKVEEILDGIKKIEKLEKEKKKIERKLTKDD